MLDTELTWKYLSELENKPTSKQLSTYCSNWFLNYTQIKSPAVWTRNVLNKQKQVCEFMTAIYSNQRHQFCLSINLAWISLIKSKHKVFSETLGLISLKSVYWFFFAYFNYIRHILFSLKYCLENWPGHVWNC